MRDLTVSEIDAVGGGPAPVVIVVKIACNSACVAAVVAVVAL